jgi:hypothetical protein
MPKKAECKNLAAPVHLAALHIVHGSIRMENVLIEPVSMVMGHSAATAASLAIDREIALQDLSYTDLKAILQKDRQILSRK